LIDRSQQRVQFLLAGQRANAVVDRLDDRFQSCLGPQVEIVRPTSFLLSCPADQAADLQQALLAAAATPCSSEALEMARIEAGFPWYGPDISEENLAPEVGRDKQAISYIKGCYLGQETIARIDALGHVNRLLMGVVFESADAPPAGTQLTANDKVVGQVTSATFSPKLQAPLALAYIRRGYLDPGTRLFSTVGPATVLGLPA
jgi:folate-binding protein YgfZ